MDTILFLIATVVIVFIFKDKNQNLACILLAGSNLLITLVNAALDEKFEFTQTAFIMFLITAIILYFVFRLAMSITSKHVYGDVAFVIVFILVVFVLSIVIAFIIGFLIGFIGTAAQVDAMNSR